MTICINRLSMGKGNFIYKTHCELAIVSNEKSLDLVTKELDISPDRFFKKGEQTISKNSGSIITKPHNLWAIRSKLISSIEESISPHIKYLQSILLSKLQVLKKYKNDPAIEVCFWIWVETDNAGIGFDLSDTEMGFINDISNKVHFSIMTNAK
jgi:hypothetical protein